MIGATATAQVATSQTIVAGCSFATTLLRVVLLKAVDRSILAWPKAEIYVVVDDLTVAVMDPDKEEAAMCTAQCMSVLMEELETNCELKIKDNKSQVLANSVQLAKRVGKLEPRLAEAQSTHARNLGVDFSAFQW